MAHTHELKKQHESDRRTALLALAASDPVGEKTDCLSSEEMAALVAGNCSAREQQRFFDHLVGCTRCYGEWIELHVVEGREQKHSDKIVKFRPFKIKNLAWAGSALAAAASVVLYLNIVRDAGPPLYKAMITEETTGESIADIQKNGLPGKDKAGRVDVPQIEKTLVPPASPERKKSRQVVRNEKAEQQAATEGMNLPGSVEQDVMEAAPVLTGMGLQMECIPKSDNAPRSMNIWLTTVRQGCLGKKQDAAFWQQQFIIGQQFLQVTKEKGAGFTEEEQQRKILEVLPRVERLAGGESGAELCAEIEGILRQ